MKKKAIILLLLFGQQLLAQDLTFKRRLAPNPSPQIIAELPDAASDFVLTDVDGDGDMDFVSVSANYLKPYNHRLLLNDGQGNYNERSFSAVSTLLTASVIKSADYDNDGDNDLMIVGTNDAYQERLYYFLNDGYGNFSMATGMPFEAQTFHYFSQTDVNNDGYIDLILVGLGGADNANQIYLNNGYGYFTAGEMIDFPDNPYAKIVYGDIDGDGDIDMLYNGRAQEGVPDVQIYTNDGDGAFGLHTSFSNLNIWGGDMKLVDMDGDNDLDMIVSGSEYNVTGAPQRLHVFHNDGLGNFVEIDDHPFPDAGYTSFSFFDPDNDGDLDLLLLGGELVDGLVFQSIAQLYMNDGNGGYSLNEDAPFIPSLHSKVVVVDVNSDGWEDLIIKHNGGASVGGLSYQNNGTLLYRNEGNAHFTQVLGSTYYSHWLDYLNFETYEGVNSFDIDQDGDQDFMVMRVGSEENRILSFYQNNGAGIFQASYDRDLSIGKFNKIQLVDIDVDGDIDILINSKSSTGASFHCFLNDGNGYFVDQPAAGITGVANGSFDIGDFDGDGDEDVIVHGNNSNLEWSTVLYENQGQGIFSPFAGIVLPAYNYGTVLMADINSDGLADVLMNGGGSQEEAEPKVFINNGANNVEELIDFPTDLFEAKDFRVLDCNGDQLNDLLVYHYDADNDSYSTALYSNNEQFDLVATTPMVFEGKLAKVIDLDLDGQLDFLIDDMGDQGLEWYRNDAGVYSNMGSLFDGYTGGITIADFTNNGDLDVLIVGKNRIENRGKTVFFEQYQCENTQSEIMEEHCNSYHAPDGAIYTESGVYTAIIPNEAGCDSVITISLEVTSFETSINHLQSNNLVVTPQNQTYQWVRCDMLNTPITMANDMFYEATEPGWYAALITMNGCTIMTDCIEVYNLDMQEYERSVSIYPNPSSDIVRIHSATPISAAAKVCNMLGEVQEVKILQETATDWQIDISGLASGMYLFISANQKSTFVKLD